METDTAILATTFPQEFVQTFSEWKKNVKYVKDMTIKDRLKYLIESDNNTIKQETNI